jgi:hypothetical protein
VGRVGVKNRGQETIFLDARGSEIFHCYERKSAKRIYEKLKKFRRKKIFCKIALIWIVHISKCLVRYQMIFYAVK